MATIEDKIIKVETPTSESDSNYEQFEYMLAWYGRDGAYLNYLFTDWENRDRVNADTLNIKDKNKLSSIISSEERPIRLVAEDLTLNDLIIIKSIAVAKNIIRVFKDGTTEKVGVSGNQKSYKQTDVRYNFTFNIEQYELALPK